jgi:hypothetical protein
MPNSFDAKTTFMLAPQRHGSNKSQALLSTHHDSMFGPFPPVLRHRFLPLQTVLGDGLIEAMVANANLSPRPLSPADDRSISARAVREVMNEKRLPLTVLGIMSGLYRVGAIREGRGEARILCKSPDNLEFFEEITTHVADADFIHVVRDPRGVWNSGRGTPRGPQTPHAAAESWNDYHGKVAELSEHFPIHTLRFEDLLTDPAAELREACIFLGIPFDSAMLDAHNSLGARIAARSNQELWGNLDKPIVPERARAWESELADQEVEIVENVCASLMRRFGYERTKAERSLTQADVDFEPIATAPDERADPRHEQIAHLRELYRASGLRF